ncbi:MAG: hypothetical protein ATN36_06125 [Epulopiscium sp. Nele67-Bin005]|nr:MAG: hypothetical protein ATN36_06125 [Epulopiscium sp. Nele67-Bin005]
MKLKKLLLIGGIGLVLSFAGYKSTETIAFDGTSAISVFADVSNIENNILEIVSSPRVIDTPWRNTSS